ADARRVDRPAAGDLREQGRSRRRQRNRDPRGRCRLRAREALAAGNRHHRPQAQRAALCLAAEHHEGQVEAARDQDTRRLRRRRRPPAQGAQGCRAARAAGRDQGRLGRRAGGETQGTGSRRMTALVLVEHEAGALKDATLAAVTAAAKLGAVHALVAGGDEARGVAEAAAEVAGVEKVLLAADRAYAHALRENVAALAAQLMADYDAFGAPATTTGKNIAPRVAALLDVMQLSEVIAIEGERTFVRPIYAGN